MFQTLKVGDKNKLDILKVILISALTSELVINTPPPRLTGVTFRVEWHKSQCSVHVVTYVRL
jgi:hypothetical protein